MKQIGNAVPPMLSKAIADAILEDDSSVVQKPMAKQQHLE
jgi:hypothetical protein